MHPMAWSFRGSEPVRVPAAPGAGCTNGCRGPRLRHSRIRLTTKYRDLGLVVAFGVQPWMYATPVVYPLSQIPERYRLLFSVNPMTNVIEAFRRAFLGTPSPEIGQVAVSLLVTVGCS